jgi:hypothetical protein
MAENTSAPYDRARDPMFYDGGPGDTATGDATPGPTPGHVITTRKRVESWLSNRSRARTVQLLGAGASALTAIAVVFGWKKMSEQRQ